jgi:hypothetical protein
MALNYYDTGTATVTNGSAAVVGQGTSWLAVIKENDLFTVEGRSIRILSVTDNTHLTLVENWIDSTVTAGAYEIRFPPPSADITASLRTLLDSLTSGILVTLTANTGTNAVTLVGSGTGDPVSVLPAGADGNIGLDLKSKGTGSVRVFVNSVNVATFTGTATDFAIAQNAASDLTLTNTNVGSAAAAMLRAANASHQMKVGIYGTGFTTSGVNRQDGAIIDSGAAAGGLTLNTGANQPIYFGINGTQKMQLDGTALGVTGNITASGDITASGSITSTGTATAASPAIGDDSTKVATTSFVQGSLPGVNLLIHPMFQVQQFLNNTAPDASYVTDCWYALTQSGSIGASALSPPVEDGFINAFRFTQSQSTAQRFGFAQILEGANCQHLIGQSVTMSGRVRCSVSTNIRYAILAYTGATNNVTRDFVNSWTNTTYTTGNFFISSNVRVLSVGVQAVTANTWTNLAALNSGTIAPGAKNLMVFIWTESALAQNVTLDCSFVQLERGSHATLPERRSAHTELMLCKRYFQRYVFGSAERCLTLSSTGTTTAVGDFMTFEKGMIFAPTASIAGGVVCWNLGQSANIVADAFSMSVNANSGTVYCEVTMNTGGGFNWVGSGQAVAISGGGATASIDLDARL